MFILLRPVPLDQNIVIVSPSSFSSSRSSFSFLSVIYLQLGRLCDNYTIFIPLSSIHLFNYTRFYNLHSFRCIVKDTVSSSSFYCPSVANAPNVLQPYWLIVLPLDVPAVTASLLLWGLSGQRWRCLWTFLFSNVPTFATSRLQEILSSQIWNYVGEK